MCLIFGAKRRLQKLEEELRLSRLDVSTLIVENEELRARLTPPAAPTERGQISNADLLQLLLKVFPGKEDKIKISDKMFEVTAISELRRFIEWDNTNIFPYVSEFHDCDDFAMALAGDFAKYPEWSGFPVSFIWGDLYGGHAFAIAVAWPSLEDRNPTVYFSEPQSDLELAMEVVEDMELWLLPM